MIKSFFFKNLIKPLAKFYWRIAKPKTYGSRALLFNNSGEILLVRHQGASYWSMPGGKIEAKEQPVDCVIRELKEELGVVDTKIRYKLGEYFSNKEGKRDTIHIFVVDTEPFNLQRQYELEDARWFNLKDLPNMGPHTSNRIREYLKGERKILGGIW